MLQKYAGQNKIMTCTLSATVGFAICFSIACLFDGFDRIWKGWFSFKTGIVVSIIFLGIGYLSFFLSPLLRILVLLVLMISSIVFLAFHFYFNIY